MGQATAPFKPQFDEKKVDIAWNEYTDQWGNQFPDGEKYSLIYPEVTLKPGCIYGKLIDKWGNEVPLSKAKVRLESSIGFIGSGLIDAIPDEDILDQYCSEGKHATLNAQFWDNTAKDFVKNTDGTLAVENGGIVYKFDYALDRASVMSDASFWEVQNVTRDDFRSHYIPQGILAVCCCRPRRNKQVLSVLPTMEQDRRPGKRHNSLWQRHRPARRNEGV